MNEERNSEGERTNCSKCRKALKPLEQYVLDSKPYGHRFCLDCYDKGRAEEREKEMSEENVTQDEMVSAINVVVSSLNSLVDRVAKLEEGPSSSIPTDKDIVKEYLHGFRKICQNHYALETYENMIRCMKGT